jgi:hypothetical protein
MSTRANEVKEHRAKRRVGKEHAIWSKMMAVPGKSQRERAQNYRIIN